MTYQDQVNLFDRAAGDEARDRGMEQAAENKRSLLEYARGVAFGLALKNGTVTADDVSERLVAAGISANALGNASGSLFKDGRFVPTGRYVKARRAQSHSRRIAEWRLK